MIAVFSGQMAWLLVITSATFAYSAMVILVAATVSTLSVRRLIDQLNLVVITASLI